MFEPLAEQDPVELEWFLERLVCNKVRSLLVLGVKYGGLEFHVANRYQSLGLPCHITGVDMTFEPDLLRTHDHVMRECKNVTLNYVRQDLSAPFVNLVLGRHDMVYIDADHQYGPVRKDFELATRCTDKLVAFHDTASEVDGSCWLWRELRDQYPYKEISVAVPGPDGFYHDPASRSKVPVAMYGVGILSLDRSQEVK